MQFPEKWQQNSHRLLRMKYPRKKKGKKRGGFPRTDAGNAELFATLFGKMFRYDYKRANVG